MGFREIIQQELDYQKGLQDSARKQARKKTEGTLYCKVRPDGRKQFYIRDPETGKLSYVNLDHLDRIRSHLIQRFGSDLLAATEENIRSLESLLQEWRPTETKDVYDRLPKVYSEARDYLLLRSDQKKYEDKKRSFLPSEKENYKEDLTQRTTFGLWVRSKGEALIAESLYSANLFFAYERKLTLLGENGLPISVHPDFTIELKPGEYLYWEHKGKLGDESYAEYDDRKSKLYYRNGIYEPVNLIVTCDSPAGGTDMQAIDRLIKGVILPQVRYS